MPLGDRSAAATIRTDEWALARGETRCCPITGTSVPGRSRVNTRKDDDAARRGSVIRSRRICSRTVTTSRR